MYALVLGIGLLLLAVLVRLDRYAAKKPLVLVEILCFIAGVSFVLGYYFPAVSRATRVYYRGKDQFEWETRLRSRAEAVRQEAIIALCEILKHAPPQSIVRTFVKDSLVDAKAREAIPLLRELQTGDDQELREIVKDLIGRLERIEPDKGGLP